MHEDILKPDMAVLEEARFSEVKLASLRQRSPPLQTQKPNTDHQHSAVPTHAPTL